MAAVLREEVWVEDEAEAVAAVICHSFHRQYASLRDLIKVN